MGITRSLDELEELAEHDHVAHHQSPQTADAPPDAVVFPWCPWPPPLAVFWPPRPLVLGDGPTVVSRMRRRQIAWRSLAAAVIVATPAITYSLQVWLRLASQ